MTDAVMHLAPHTQAFGTTAGAIDTAGSDGRPMTSAGSVPVAAGSAASPAVAAEPVAPGAVNGVTPHAVSSDAASSAAVSPGGAAPEAASAAASAATANRPTRVSDAPSEAASSTPVATGDAARPASSETPASMVVATREAPPLPRAAVDTAPAAGVVGDAAATQSSEATVTGQPAAGGTPPPPATAQPAAPEPTMAAFYATRGDAMLANRDISAARKFYEYAANAGSARAATALARTYDPAFAAQLGPAGLRPDPQPLASLWYRKAAELAGATARLSQSGDTGK